MKKILLVINTLGRAGAEASMLEFLKRLDRKNHEIFLYVMMGQGRLSAQLPPDIRVLNQKFSCQSVWGRRGRLRMAGTVAAAYFRNGNYWKKLCYFIKDFKDMIRAGRFQIDKL